VTVTKEIERLEHSALKLTITVKQEDTNAEYNNLLADYTKSVQIPGFRKGKVPKEVLIRKFGSSLKEQACGKIIEKSLVSILEDESLPREQRPLPYSQPQMQGEPKLDLNADFVYSVVYDTLPKVTVGQYQGLEVTIPEITISDEDINRELETIRERNAIVMDKDDDAPAEKDNVVTVNYSELDDNGNVIPDTEREDYVFALGSGNNIFKFDDEITGMKKEETRDIEKSYGEDFEDKDLAGKTKKLRISLTALKEKKLPDLDDDLAQDVDEKYDTLDDLKNSIRERFQNNLDNRLRALRINALLEKIMENTPVDVPDSMVRIELEGRWRSLARQFGATPDALMESFTKNGSNVQTIIDGWRPAAVKSLHSRLIVETLIEDLALEASDEEAEKEIERIADESGSTVEEVKKYYEGEAERESLKEDIKEKKLYDKLAAENTIKTGEKKSYLDVINGSP
jgi:trigger factor